MKWGAALLSLISLAGGCIIRGDFDPLKEEASCEWDLDCPVEQRCNGSVCTSGCIDDDECEPPFACGLPGDERTGSDGCYERCLYDEECQAGYICSSNGDCVQ